MFIWFRAQTAVMLRAIADRIEPVGVALPVPVSAALRKRYPDAPDAWLRAVAHRMAAHAPVAADLPVDQPNEAALPDAEPVAKPSDLTFTPEHRQALPQPLADLPPKVARIAPDFHDARPLPDRQQPDVPVAATQPVRAAVIFSLGAAERKSEPVTYAWQDAAKTQESAMFPQRAAPKLRPSPVHEPRHRAPIPSVMFPAVTQSNHQQSQPVDLPDASADRRDDAVWPERLARLITPTLADTPTATTHGRPVWPDHATARTGTAPSADTPMAPAWPQLPAANVQPLAMPSEVVPTYAALAPHQEARTWKE